MIKFKLKNWNALAMFEKGWNCSSQTETSESRTSRERKTDGLIDKLQNYYVIAIQSNVGNL